MVFAFMKALQIEYPESWPDAAGSSAERFEDEARMALAMKLFEMGRLSSGQAAQLAGVSRAVFCSTARNGMCQAWFGMPPSWKPSSNPSHCEPVAAQPILLASAF